MKIITDKKELIKTIGDWTTVHIYSEYEMGSNQIKLKYNGNEVMFINDDIKYVAYIAAQCHAITNRQYGTLI